jgi:predicted dehydrogenase
MAPAGHARKKKAIAVIGGGRWARVFISTLAGLNLPYQLVVVSAKNRKKISDIYSKNGSRLEILPTVNDLTDRYDVVAAVIINASKLHYRTALNLFGAKTSVLIEKPLALEISEVEHLFAQADTTGAHVVPCLTYLNCSYLDHFRRLMKKQEGKAIRLRLEWSDPRSEVRYGEAKAYDPGISIAQDIMPHIWAVLVATTGMPGGAIAIDACIAERGGRGAIFEFKFNGIQCHVAVQREAQMRCRHLAIEFTSGQELAIDFTSEPGEITLGPDTICGDPHWAETERPLLKQWKNFFARLGQSADNTSSFLQSMGSVSLAQSANDLLKRQQISWLASQPVSKLNDDVTYAIGEIAGSKLYKQENISPGDTAAFTKHVNAMISRIRAGNPSESLDWVKALKTLV